MKTYQAKIVKRFYSDKEIAAFEESYINHRFLQKSIRKPSQNELRMAKSLKETKSVSRVAHTFHVPAYQVYRAMARVEAYSK